MLAGLLNVRVVFAIAAAAVVTWAAWTVFSVVKEIGYTACTVEWQKRDNEALRDESRKVAALQRYISSDLGPKYERALASNAKADRRRDERFNHEASLSIRPESGVCAVSPGMLDILNEELACASHRGAEACPDAEVNAEMWHAAATALAGADRGGAQAGGSHEAAARLRIPPR